MSSSKKFDLYRDFAAEFLWFYEKIRDTDYILNRYLDALIYRWKSLSWVMESQVYKIICIPSMQNRFKVH